jgi:organic hydroperoxide reductase OsmC/OhrA
MEPGEWGFMSEHHASIRWVRCSESFAYPDYNRNHAWVFPGGTKIAASAATQFLGEPDCVDPEEAFVAAISSCHMLTFLAICARKRITVNSYRDDAVGYLKKNGQGKLSITRVTLKPDIAFDGEPPDPDQMEQLHYLSHEECFIANSVNTEIKVIDQYLSN